MGAGIQIFNDNNQIVIDADYLNYRLMQKGSVVVNSQHQVDGYVGVSAKIIYHGQADSVPMLAFRSDDGLASHAFTLRTGNIFNFYLSGEHRINPVSNMTLFFYLFDIVQPGARPALGPVAVWDAKGRVVFDSSLEYLWPVDILGIQDVEAQWSSEGAGTRFSKSYMPGRDYAVAYFSGVRDSYNYYELFGNGTFYKYDGISRYEVGVTAGGFARVEYREVYLSQPVIVGSQGPDNYRREGNFLIGIIDVTGFV